jgi:hypothetical protein
MQAQNRDIWPKGGAAKVETVAGTTKTKALTSQ